MRATAHVTFVGRPLLGVPSTATVVTARLGAAVTSIVRRSPTILESRAGSETVAVRPGSFASIAVQERRPGFGRAGTVASTEAVRGPRSLAVDFARPRTSGLPSEPPSSSKPRTTTSASRPRPSRSHVTRKRLPGWTVRAFVSTLSVPDRGSAPRARRPTCGGTGRGRARGGRSSGSSGSEAACGRGTGVVEAERLSESFCDTLLSWRHSGFSVHGGQRLDAGEGDGLERLARYVTRPALATGAVTMGAGGRAGGGRHSARPTDGLDVRGLGGARVRPRGGDPGPRRQEAPRALLRGVQPPIPRARGGGEASRRPGDGARRTQRRTERARRPSLPPSPAPPWRCGARRGRGS